MRSHEYQLGARGWVQTIVPTLGVLAGASLLLHLAAWVRALPEPPVGWDAESGVLAHQSAACRAKSDARLLIVGDSTCLVGVDASELSRLLPGRTPVLSLALFIWLDLSVYGEEVADFARANPDQLRTVVLLVTPPKLAGMGHDPSAAQVWQEVHRLGVAGKGDAADSGSPDWLAGHIARRHLLSQILATPLRGNGAGFFGFASEVDSYMTRHRGSLASPGTAPPLRSAANQPSAQLVLAPALEEESRAFRARVPAGAKLYIGLTPVPDDTESPAYRQRQLDFLDDWNRWIHADVLLTNLPPTLPGVMFSGGGHLNQRGQERFTAALGRELSRFMIEQESPKR